MSQATVREAMTSSPRSIPSDATVVEAAKLMTAENVGSLPVMDGEQLVGIVTDRDLVTKGLAKDLDPRNVRVADVYTQDPVVTSPDESLDKALERMAAEQVRRLPVVAEGRLVGILAQADVARTAEPKETGQMVEEISKE